MGGRALRIGVWKIAALKGENWELFNLAEDHTETTDLAKDFPEKVQGMEEVWNAYYKRINP